ncbi:diguanylate cyclase [Phytohabitans houttuyneae]|uniref:diguanylate cyclase n=2 Tax=Phytohabitans houttuyneae TaxID=1076126 RepID=UPI0031EE548E
MISKEPLGPDADRRLRHELAILSRLSGLPGIAQLAAAPARPGAILLADVGGVSLGGTALPWRPVDLIALALSLGRAVAGMHQRGVMHTDISPTNILVSDKTREPWLIDFALATTFVQTRPDLTPTEIVGTLPYLAPELTGRTGRAVDQRADLYALGATLYETATGKPPFGAGDPLQLVHDHLARVPVPPAEVNPAIPGSLSAIIMHLLEKEPDNRYQTAEGLIHDLVRVREGSAEHLHIGERDFPLRLRPPSRIVGRDSEIDALAAAFEASKVGNCPGLLVGGAPGVGKTSLIEQLRPLVAASGGWFVSGKFDQYRRDLEFDGVHQAFRALGRLLLALPEDELAEVRGRILRALGHGAGLATAVTPELATLLRVEPERGDPLTAEARAQRNSLEILRAVASRERPVVFVVDDLQWAGRTPVGFVEMVLGGHEKVDGLLLVSAYREPEADHPLAALISRWQREKTGPARLWLGDLSATSLATLVADMLRMEVDEVAPLAESLLRRTGGNPYETVELLNSLRRDGVLWPADKGWEWDPSALRGAAGPVDLPDLFTTRVAALPPETRGLLELMTCLGGRVEVDLLRAATDLPASTVRERLGPALEDGLLVMESADQEAVRFRHDRVWEGALAYLTPERQRTVRLHLARRLAARPELSTVAAQQYLHLVDIVRDPDERRRAVALLRRAAEEARLVSNYSLVERLLSAAVRLADADDSALLIALHTGRLAALYGLGRLDDADEVYRVIDRLATDPVQRTGATLVQVSSLANRSRPQEAIEVGIEVLRRLGVAMPAVEQLEGEVDRSLDALYRWLDRTSEDDDLARPEITDPSLLAAAALINRMLPPAFQSNPATMVWLVLQAVWMWVEHGPGRTLVGPVAHLPFATTRRRQDYRTGYRMMRRVLAVSEARGYEPDTSQARFLYAFAAGHWFAPLEECVAQARRAWEGLLQGGDVQNACWTANVLVYAMLDCAPTLDAYIPDVEAALGIARRTGNEHSAALTQPYAWLLSTLRGAPIDAPAPSDRLADNPTVASNVHITRALAAAVLDEPAELDRHSAAAMALLPFMENLYLSVPAYLTRALALAAGVRTAEADAPQRSALLAELDTVAEWWRARAADAPTNFRHLWHLVQAERAWATGDFRAAVSAFDSAQRDASVPQRPWHRALIAERAARFYLAHGVAHTGHALLADACRGYLDWGATAKVERLRQANPDLLVADGVRALPAPGSAGDAPAHRASIMTGAIDLLGILAASQALSSETSLDGLRHRVVDVLSAMTGATGVQLLLWEANTGTWRLPAATSETASISLDEAVHRRLVPLSAVRYVERTREPLLLSDALSDDRFARDPYFDGHSCCSLLAVPILNRATLQALLLLENRLIRGAFSTERLDGLMLIAGQLAVSLDNALVYASLERKVAERTRQLAIANEHLERLSVTDALTGLANRRRFEEVLNTEWDRAVWAGSSLALAMIDVDHFKRYNDHYGHPAGDECLHRVADLLRQRSLAGHLVARYGGEEFAVIMPDTGIHVAGDIAEGLRTAVLGLGVPHHMVAAGVVTASIGVAAAVPTAGTSADHLVELADVELYRAKRAGRNRVRCADTDGA